MFRVVTLGEFVNTEEEGAEPLVGEGDESALIVADSDVMFYGDGGAGKTTLVVDLAFHLGAGDPWLGMKVSRKLRVLIVENEGPRAPFRKKLCRKRAAWRGSAIGENVRVLEEPWAELTLADENHRAFLAAAIAEHEIDVLVIGPVTAAGMLEAGTIQEVRDFMRTKVADVRNRSGRPVAIVVVHHESKSGRPSGAWEGVGDTLIHVQALGHGKTRLFFQKARWSEKHHQTGMELAWADGQGFEVTDKAEVTASTIAEEILEAALQNGGGSWNTISKNVTGQDDRKREIRDRLLAAGRLGNVGGSGGMKLWHHQDPERPATQTELRPDRDAPGTHFDGVR
jgi:hypothetical protein